MDHSPFIITVGLANILALAGLIFKAGGLVKSIGFQDRLINTMTLTINELSHQIDKLNQRLAIVEGRLSSGNANATD